jgi:hypothetical protein
VRLVESRAAVEAAKRNGRQAASYSVVPYEGPNRTHRRPIYIECRQDAMILQPEGIELTPADFAGFLGPGNPLAQALRGAREYYARQSTAGAAADEPYPLLLVRPEGIATYYAARSALESWGSEFGYELIGSDWTLKFSQPDPRLAELMRQIVADARMRMRELMLATSQLAAHRPRSTLRASASGGFVADRAGSGRRGAARDSGGGWDSLDSQWTRGAGTLNGDEVAGATGSGGSATAGGGERSALGGGSSQIPGGGRLAAAGGSGSHAPFSQPGTADGQLEGHGNANAAGQPNGQQNAMADGNAIDGTRAVASPQSTDRYGARSDGATSGQSASPSGTADNRSSNSAASSGSGAGSGGQDSSASADMAHSAIVQNHKPRKTTSLAKVRGRDWGLPDAGAGMAPATRPILVECHHDRLVIVPDEPGTDPKVTRLGDETRENIDEFVSDVWQHMRGWGIAGRGLYWRPTLAMAVEPGAADRYAEIKALLADSGLDVRERRPRAATTSPSTGSKRR